MEEQQKQSEEPRKRILVPTGKRYSGAAVERMIKEYKKRSREDVSKANKYKKMYEKTMVRYLRVRESVKKTNKKVWFKIGRERGNHRVSVKRYKKRIENLKIKYKQQQKEYRSAIRKKIYKEIKAKYKFYDPNESVNINYVKTVVWARIYAKLSLVKRKTKLTPREIVVVLFLSQYENGANANQFRKDIKIANSALYSFSARLRRIGIVSREKYNSKYYTYFLTDRGRSFAESILNYVKKEKESTVVKKIKPKYIRNKLPASTAATPTRPAEQQSSS
jgi:DNA-binding MarR family transcriptional regulator